MKNIIRIIFLLNMFIASSFAEQINDSNEIYEESKSNLPVAIKEALKKLYKILKISESSGNIVVFNNEENIDNNNLLHELKNALSIIDELLIQKDINKTRAAMLEYIKKTIEDYYNFLTLDDDEAEYRSRPYHTPALFNGPVFITDVNDPQGYAALTVNGLANFTDVNIETVTIDTLDVANLTVSNSLVLSYLANNSGKFLYLSDNAGTVQATGTSGIGVQKINAGNNISVDTSSGVHSPTINVAGTTTNAVQIGSPNGALHSLSFGTSGYVLTSQGANNSPQWESLSSVGAVTSVKPGNNIAITGTATSPVVNVAGTTTNAVQMGSLNGSLQSLSFGNSGQVLTSQGANVLPQWITPTHGTVTSVTTGPSSALYISNGLTTTTPRIDVSPSGSIINANITTGIVNVNPVSGNAITVNGNKFVVDYQGNADINGDVTLTNSSATLQLPAGSTSAPSLNFTGSTTTGLSASSGNLSFSTNGAESMKISSAGTVSIDQFTTAGVIHNDASGNLSSSLIVNADISSSAAIADTKLATISTPGKVANSATTATSSNTPSTIVARDSSGNFSAGTITASLTGHASLDVLKAGDTMTGTLTLPAGSSATPSLQFTGSANTGLSAPSINTLSFSTNGSAAMNINGSGQITIDGFSSAGVVHNNASGLLSTSLIVDADITTATITNDKLANISSSDIPGDIVVRDGSGNFSTNMITIDGNPSANTDVATVAYVKSAAGTGLVVHPPAEVVAVSNYSPEGEQTIDGVTLASGDRVLLQSQTNPIENGLWVAAVGALSPWYRPTDFANGSPAGSAYVLITEGTNYAGSSWVCSTPTAIIGSSPIYFQEFSLPNQVTGANVGAGGGQIFQSKSGITLNFRTITGDSYLTASTSPTEVTISSHASPSNIPSTIVARDGSGNFAAGDITVAGLTVNGDALITGTTTLQNTLNLDLQSEIDLHDLNTTNYVGLKAPATVNSSYTLLFPPLSPTFNQVLQAGSVNPTQLEWVAKGGDISPSVSRIIYVSQYGNDITGDGSFEYPYASLARAVEIANTISTVSDPTVIAIAPGIYTENNSTGPITVTTGGVSIVGESANSTFIFPNTLSQDLIAATTGTRFIELTFESGGISTASAISLSGPGNTTSFSNVRVINFATGISCGGANSTYLLNYCILTGNGTALNINDNSLFCNSCSITGNATTPENTGISATGASADILYSGGIIENCATGIILSNNADFNTRGTGFRNNIKSVSQNSASTSQITACTFQVNQPSGISVQASGAGTTTEILGSYFNGANSLGSAQGTGIQITDEAAGILSAIQIMNYITGIQVGSPSDTSSTILTASSTDLVNMTHEIIQNGSTTLMFNGTANSDNININDSTNVELSYFDSANNTLTIGKGSDTDTSLITVATSTSPSTNPQIVYNPAIYSTQAIGYQNQQSSPASIFALTGSDANLTAITTDRTKISGLRLVSDTGLIAGGTSALRGWDVNKNASAAQLSFSYQNSDTGDGQAVIPEYTLLQLDGVNNQVQIPDTATEMVFGGDTYLYRSAANTLKTDGNLIIGNSLTVTPLTAHGVLVGEASNPIVAVAPGTPGYVLTSNGSSADPSFQSLSAIGGVTSVSGGTGIHVTGTATSPIVNLSPTTTNALQIGSADHALRSLSFGTSGYVLTSQGANNSPQWESLSSAGAVTSVQAGDNIAVTGTASSPVVNVAGTTTNAVQIGSPNGALHSLAVGTNGQVLLGATGAAPAFASLTSSAATLTYTPGANSLNIDITAPVAITYGGTNATSFSSPDGVIYYDGTRLATTNAGISGTVLSSNGAGSSPTFKSLSALGAVTSVTGGTGINVTGTATAPIVNLSPTTTNALQIGSADHALQSLSFGTSGYVLTSQGANNSPQWESLSSAGAITTINGDNGFVMPTNGAVTFNANSNAGSTVKFSGSGSTMDLLVTSPTTFNTFIGLNAGSPSTTGNDNTAIGYDSLPKNTTGQSNTALGFAALAANTNGSYQTAIGSGALHNVAVASYNTAVGYQALYNTTTQHSTAVGYQALYNNNGDSSTAIGFQALFNNTTGVQNSAIGYQSLFANTGGSQNLAVGDFSLSGIATGSNNVGIGRGAGSGIISSGSNNISVGAYSGTASNIGSNNIYISHTGAAESNAIRIGTAGTQAECYIAGISGVSLGNANAVYIDSSGHLGTSASSGGSITTINGDTGSVSPTNGAVTFNANSNAGSTVKFSGSGSTMDLLVTDPTLFNTFIGLTAGNSSMTGTNNTAIGYNTLSVNTSGFFNLAAGSFALASNTTGIENVAVGYASLGANTTGQLNNALGVYALQRNTTGSSNVAIGHDALNKSISGSNNTALGNSAILNTLSGMNNIAVGASAGSAYNNSESNNIVIGNTGLAGESNVIRIGGSINGSPAQSECYIAGISGVSLGAANAVYIDSSGHLGTSASSGGSITTINGDTGSVSPTNGAVTFNANSNAGGTVKFSGSGSTMDLLVTSPSLFNTFIGLDAGNTSATGNDNTAVGYKGITAITTGSQNTALGMNALTNITTGTGNVALGINAGMLLFSAVANNVAQTITASSFSAPEAIAITPDGETAYVCNYSGNSVSIINVATNTVTGTVSGTFSAPDAIAITPNGNTAYVCNYGLGTVSIINVATNTVTGTVSGTFGRPVAIAITPDGNTAYVCNYLSNSVSIINIATNTVTGTVSGGSFSGPNAIAITPNGNTAYVCNYSGNSVSIINVATNTVTGTVSGGSFSAPYAIAITPDGNTAYVSNSLGNSVSIINVATNTVTGTVSDPNSYLNQPQNIVLDPGGNAAYVCCVGGSGQVVIIDVSTNTAIGIVGGAVSPFDIAFTGNTGYITTLNNSVDVFSLTTIGNNNIYIGNQGLFGDGGVTRIGSPSQTACFIAGIKGITIPSGVPVYISPTTGQLATVASTSTGVITTINGDNGSVIPISGVVTFNANSNAGGTVKFSGSGSAMDLLVTSPTTHSTAIGAGASVSGNLSTAFGYNSSTGSGFFQSTAIGAQAVTGGNNSAVFGYNASSGALESTAIGSRASATGNNSTALGYAALASGSISLAIGNEAGSSNNASVSGNNIYIANIGVGGESNVIRVGTEGTQTSCFIGGINGITIPSGVPVYISPTTGQLATVASTSTGIITTINGDNGSVTPASGVVTFNANSNAGATVKFSGSGSTMDLLVTDPTLFNTFIGLDAGSSSATGADNVALGYQALASNTIGFQNTAIGYQALKANTGASYNTAVGYQALASNTTGFQNTAIGFGALATVATASYNTAVGFEALNQTTNQHSTAVGYQALYSNNGDSSTAMGYQALFNNTTGIQNAAIGYQALVANTTGNGNVAIGDFALNGLTTGANNVSIGRSSGGGIVGSNNVSIGEGSGSSGNIQSNNIYISNAGFATESNGIHIGTQGTQTACYIAGISGATSSGGVTVFVNSSGQLGTATSSRRYKENIVPVTDHNKLMELEPVQFTYKSDNQQRKQYGLIAEDVYEVYPELVVHNEAGEVETVRYDQLHALLLKGLQEQQKEINDLKNIAAKQQRLIDDLFAEKGLAA